jgi:MraZ protein
VLRGSTSARIDDKGRLKVPNAFRRLVEQKHGREVFLTSLTGEYVRIYPMPVWLELEERLAAMPSTHPAKLRFLDRINYYGSDGELDAQGRVIIPARLRDAASMTGDVDVLGQVNYLDVWNHDRFVAKMQREPFTDDDARALSEHGI